MFSAAVRVLARVATIQLEEAAAAHPRPPRTLLKGKERAIPIRRHIRPEPAVVESDLGVHAGTEGYDEKDIELDPSGRTVPVGHGMEEHLASIVDEIPQEVENTAGPSRTARHAQKVVHGFSQEPGPSTSQAAATKTSSRPYEQLEVDASRSAPLPRQTTAPSLNSKPVTKSTVEDSPLVQAELPVSDQLHEILNAKSEGSAAADAKSADHSDPEAVKPVESRASEGSPKDSAYIQPLRAEEVESGDILPTTNVFPTPVAEEAEDVSLYTLPRVCLTF